MNHERISDPRMSRYRKIYASSPYLEINKISNKTCIVYCEQGFGDIIQSLRYVPILAQLNCKVILHCPQSLFRIAMTVEGCYGVFDKNSDDLPPHDFHVLSLDLPFILKELFGKIPYVNVKTKKELNNSNYKIGICWEADNRHETGPLRSLPLSVFKSLKKDNTSLYMLQTQIFNKPDIDLELFVCQLNDWMDTAELINALDLVVSVDTAVLHLAGAMGTNAIGILSKASDGRWEFGNDFYPSIQIVFSPSEACKIASTTAARAATISGLTSSA